MDCKPRNSAVRRYNRRTFGATAAYLVTLLCTTLIVKHLHPPHSVAVILAIVPAIPIAATIAIVGLYLKEEKDEFQRELLIQTILWATAFTLVTTSTWGLLEIYASVSPLTSFYVYVIFWFFYLIVTIPIRLRYRTGSND